MNIFFTIHLCYKILFNYLINLLTILAKDGDEKTTTSPHSKDSNRSTLNSELRTSGSTSINLESRPGTPCSGRENRARSSSSSRDKERSSTPSHSKERHRNSSGASTPVSTKDSRHISVNKSGSSTRDSRERSSLNKTGNLIATKAGQSGNQREARQHSGASDDTPTRSKDRKRTRQAIQSPANSTPDHGTAKRVRRT